MTNHKAGENLKDKQYKIRIDTELYIKFNLYAKKRGVSMSELTRDLMEKAIKESSK